MVASGGGLRMDAPFDGSGKYTTDVLDSVPVALTLRDASGKYLFVNRQWERWFAPRGETVATTVQERLPPEVAREALALDHLAFERGPDAPPRMDDI